MRLFLFAIGGTGARVVRSLTMMLASGIERLDSSTEIVPIIIDYDISNGDKTRAIKALKSYSSIHHFLYPDSATVGVNYSDHFFMTRFTPLNQAGIAAQNSGDKDYEFNFGPSGHQIKFADYLNIGAMDTDPDINISKDLLHSLYDDSDANDKNAELNLDLAKGFKGNPNIGSVVFHDLRNRPEFKQFEGTFDAERDKVFIISSIFGGTGSSGFPEIVNAIRTNSHTTLQPAHIGAAVILPYFDLLQYNPDNGDTGAIDAGSFNAKTRAALSYYAQVNGINTQINSLYYIGDENHDSYQYNEGEERQQNDAHVVEFVAASAIIDFMTRNTTPQQHNAYEFCIKDARISTNIQLPDFFDCTHALFLNNLSYFAFGMKYYRDVVCGDRNRVSSDTAYYKSERFNLTGKLGRDVYSELDSFLDAQCNNKWGFYSWLGELIKHTHRLYPYYMSKDKKMKNILTYKEIEDSLFSHPVSDDNISSEINKLSKSFAVYNDTTFFKVLRDVARLKYNNVK